MSKYLNLDGAKKIIDKVKTLVEPISNEEIDSLFNVVKTYKVYGVQINTKVSDPEASVSYTDDSVNIAAASNDWDQTEIFKDIKPCLFKNGQVQYYLDPNDFSKKEDGSNADITSGNDGDVMIEIPKMGYKITKQDGIIKVQITRNPNAGKDGFCYYAHTRDVDGDRDNLYIGAYLNNYEDGVNLTSLSGKAPAGHGSFVSHRNIIKARGEGYDIWSFYPHVLIQCLYIMRYKNLNSQAALGRGNCNTNSMIATGTLDSNGMNYGVTTDSAHDVKFIGISSIWGNSTQLLEGAISSNGAISTKFKDFGENYTNVVAQSSMTTGVNFTSDVCGTNEGGFLPVANGASANTYFSDLNLRANGTCFAFVSGYYKDNDYVGMFFNCYNAAQTDSSPWTCSRLMYL